MANLACYPAINVPNGFTDDGQPTNVTFFARPFGEMELLALAKAYQDAAGFHLKKPTKLDARRDGGVGERPVSVSVVSYQFKALPDWNGEP